jgi:hypothetical protein
VIRSELSANLNFDDVGLISIATMRLHRDSMQRWCPFKFIVLTVRFKLPPLSVLFEIGCPVAIA